MLQLSNGIIRTNNLLVNVPAMRLTSGNVTATHGGVTMFGILSQKRCKQCGELKDKSEFGKHKIMKDGLRTVCKACNVANASTYAAKNQQKIAEYKHGRYEMNREEHSKAAKVYYQKHAEEIKQSTSAWYRQNKEIVKVINAAWRKLNPDKVKGYTKKWAINNPDKVAQQHKRWQAANPEKSIEYSENRRARKLNNGGTFTAQEWQSLKELYGYTCLRCGRSEPEITLSADHVIPLKLGGRNSIDNIQPLCRSCNSRKHTKVIDYR
jgi:5-methylcytosine-specific restriction endonuclease McrA